MTATTAFRTPVVSGSTPLRFRERANARVGTAELLVFRVGDERFAVDLQSVEETMESLEMHVIAESSPTVLGVFTHRDRFIPLYHTAALLGMNVPPEKCQAGLVMRGGGHSVGISVADVEDVVTVELATLRNVPEGAWNDDLVLGLLVRNDLLIALLDARALVSACQTAPIPEAL